MIAWNLRDQRFPALTCLLLLFFFHDVLRQQKHTSETKITDSVLKQDSNKIKGSKERLFIRSQTHSLQIFGVIPFVSLQNNTTLNKIGHMRFEQVPDLSDYGIGTKKIKKKFIIIVH